MTNETPTRHPDRPAHCRNCGCLLRPVRPQREPEECRAGEGCHTDNAEANRIARDLSYLGSADYRDDMAD